MYMQSIIERTLNLYAQNLLSEVQKHMIFTLVKRLQTNKTFCPLPIFLQHPSLDNEQLQQVTELIILPITHVVDFMLGSTNSLTNSDPSWIVFMDTYNEDRSCSIATYLN